MITINIIQHTDPDLLGLWNWNKNIITIGPKGDYYYPNIKDEEIAVFEVKDDGLTIYPGSSLDFYICNGKRAKSSKKIKLGETLIINDIHLQIVAFTFIPLVERVPFLKLKFNEIRENNKSLFELISKVEKSLQNL